MPSSRIPLSRLERGTPPPRTKSCAACIKAKRRCDRALPTCARCTNRHLACEYPKAGTATPRRAALQHVECLPTYVDHDEADHYASAHNWPFDPDSMLEFGLDGLDFTSLSLPPAITPTAFSEAPLLSFQQEELHPRVLHLDVDAIAERMERNLSYAVDQIKRAPRTMLLETRTPWCHAALYTRAMPRAMQDALSACALYQSKNSINSPVIIRCINTKVSDLLRSSALPTERLEVLAHTQALLLYQVILFFDGDILARTSADATFDQLDASSRSLYKHIDWNPATDSRASGCVGNDFHPPITHGSLASELQTPTAAAADSWWHDWVFQESARRTYLIARFFLSVWNLLTGQVAAGCHHQQGDNPNEPPGVNQEEEHWTLSAHLWQATDPVNFAAAWSGKKHFVVRRKAIFSTLADASCEDVEDFGKMILTTSMGVTPAKVWLASIGATL